MNSSPTRLQRVNNGKTANCEIKPVSESCFTTLIKESDDDNYQFSGSNTINYDRMIPNFRFIIALRGKDPPAEYADKLQVVNVRKWNKLCVYSILCMYTCIYLGKIYKDYSISWAIIRYIWSFISFWADCNVDFNSVTCWSDCELRMYFITRSFFSFFL